VRNHCTPLPPVPFDILPHVILLLSEALALHHCSTGSDSALPPTWTLGSDVVIDRGATCYQNVAHS
jgi:hypothetical protein